MLSRVEAVPTGAVITINDFGQLVSAERIDHAGKPVLPRPGRRVSSLRGSARCGGGARSSKEETCRSRGPVAFPCAIAHLASGASCELSQRAQTESVYLESVTPVTSYRRTLYVCCLPYIIPIRQAVSSLRGRQCRAMRLVSRCSTVRAKELGSSGSRHLSDLPRAT